VIVTGRKHHSVVRVRGKKRSLAITYQSIKNWVISVCVTVMVFLYPIPPGTQLNICLTLILKKNRFLKLPVGGISGKCVNLATPEKYTNVPK